MASGNLDFLLVEPPGGEQSMGARRMRRRMREALASYLAREIGKKIANELVNRIINGEEPKR